MALSYVRQNGGYPASAGTSVTFTLDCTGGDLVVVGAGDRGLPTGATLNGVSMTAFTGVTNGASNARQFYMANPPTGTQTIVISYGSSVFMAGTASLWSGFSNGTVAAATTNSGTGTSVTSSSISTTTDDVIIDFVSHGSAGLTVGGSQTQISNNFYANSDASSYRAGTGGSFTMSWSTSVSSVWSQSVAKITPGAATNSNFLMFM